MNRERILSREVTATQIPSGDKQPLPAGSRVFLHQTLGGSYTVQTDFGLYRIDGKDGDALGETVAETKVAAATLSDGAPDPEAVWAQLRQVYDPEIPVNIVDLGLVYDLNLEPAPGGGNAIEIKMTLTAPGCGMGPTLARDAEQLARVRVAVVHAVQHHVLHGDEVARRGGQITATGVQ